jgi:hypothetical protein
MHLPYGTRPRSWGRLAILLLASAAFAAVACHQVATGQLHRANDLSGLGRDNTVLRAVAPNAGDPWPAAGEVGILVQGDDFGSPPSFGLNAYFYLVRTSAPCPQSEGTPETFKLSQVTIAGILTSTNGSVNQVVTMPDTPANRAPTWAIIAIPEMPGTGGAHFISRCGSVTWTP